MDAESAMEWMLECVSECAPGCALAWVLPGMAVDGSYKQF
jgi:hypothetical protein